MGRTALVAVAVGMLGVASALEVVSPSAGTTVIADRSYTVEWTGTGSNSRFEIDLYYCGSYCTEDDCGEWVTALCPYGEDGCPDNEGDYDVLMPEPFENTSGSGYKIRVQDVSDESDYDCSDEFYLLASEDTSTMGEEDGPTLEVTAPDAGDVAMAGDEYTVEWDYDDGFGSQVGRFAIDLYTTGGSGDCGTFYATICDKPTIGCKDSMGDYDITIPSDAESGMYRIRVGLFEDDNTYDCSGSFEVMGDDGDGDDSDDDETSMSFRF
eukprot:jgi/Undpi1/13214/HiC_scaffold_8.g02876.m1